MIKVAYDATTGEIKGYYPDSIGYSSIPEPNIEIDEAAHLDCINNNGLRRVDLTTLTIVSKPADITVLTKTQKLNALNAEYLAKKEILNRRYTSITMANTDETKKATKLAALQTEYTALLAELILAQGVIING